ncbi:hypothetical protein PQX77_001685, partial [Marasmius sp. AFHP31]
AEIAMDNLQYAFWHSGKHHSVLKVIIRTRRKRLEASQSLFAFVGAGSRISALHFDDPYNWDDWAWSSNTRRSKVWGICASLSAPHHGVLGTVGSMYVGQAPR